MVWFSFLINTEDSTLSDSSEIGVRDLSRSRKRSLPSSVSLSHQDSLRPEEKQGNGKNVSFDSVTVRYFNLILGDNDGCCVPLSIGWKWVESEPMSVDIYDEMYHQDPDYVCAMKMKPLDLEERKRRLYVTGYSKQDVRREERRRRIQLAMSYGATENGDECCPIIAANANTSIFIKRYLLS
jgi:hypothetical protein